MDLFSRDGNGLASSVSYCTFASSILIARRWRAVELYCIIEAALKDILQRILRLV